MYSLIIFIISLADALVAYTSPVYMEQTLRNPALTGIVLSTSSMVGFVADIVMGEVFAGKRYNFFLWWTGIVGILYTLSLLLFPPIVSIFILAMGMWGIYYELIQFSNFTFIHAFMKPDQHATAWGVISVFKSTAYVLGPLVAGSLLVATSRWPFFWSLILFITGILAATFFHKKFDFRRITQTPHHKHRMTLLFEMRVWKLLFGRIWPVWLFVFSLYFIDATFWSVGTLLSEEIRGTTSYGTWLLPLYMMPSLVVGFFARRLSGPLGKKRTAFIAGLFGGCVLLMAGISQSIPLLFLLIFSSSLFIALAVPEILAVFEDYVARLGNEGMTMVSLEQAAVSLAYIVGPMGAGLIAAVVGYHKTFSVAGGVLVVVSLIALVATPRKILLPQTALHRAEENRV